MTDFKDDLPRRKLAAVPPAGMEEVAEAVWLYTDPVFFLQRDKDNLVRPQAVFAPVVVDELVERVPKVRHVVCFQADQEVLLMEIQAYATGKGLLFTPFRIKDNAAGETTLRLKEVLGQHGVVFKPIRNLRTVSYLNVGKFVSNPNKFRMVANNEHEALGMQPPKDPSFQELVERRKRSGWP